MTSANFQAKYEDFTKKINNVVQTVKLHTAAGKFSVPARDAVIADGGDAIDLINTMRDIITTAEGDVYVPIPYVNTDSYWVAVNGPQPLKRFPAIQKDLSVLVAEIKLACQQRRAELISSKTNTNLVKADDALAAIPGAFISAENDLINLLTDLEADLYL